MEVEGNLLYQGEVDSSTFQKSSSRIFYHLVDFSLYYNIIVIAIAGRLWEINTRFIYYNTISIAMAGVYLP